METQLAEVINSSEFVEHYAIQRIHRLPLTFASNICKSCSIDRVTDLRLVSSGEVIGCAAFGVLERAFHMRVLFVFILADEFYFNEF